MTIAIVNSKGSVGKTTVALNLAHALQRDGHATQLIDLDDGQNDLKANQNFQELQGQLEETETRISQSRRFYNANVRELNTSVESFPNSLIAGNFGFKSEQYFEIDEPFARAPVQVRF